MKTRGFGVGLAIALAAVAPGGVYLYVEDAKEEDGTAASYGQAGDHVTIYGEGDINLIQGKFSKLLGHPVQTTKTDIGDWSFTVVPQVRVLRVLTVTGGTGTGTSTGAASGTQDQLQVTLEL